MRRTRWAPAIGLLAGVAVAFGLWVLHRGPVPRPKVPLPAHGHCVLPAAVMRRAHMQILRAVRTRVVRHNARLRRFRLTRCVSCHVQYTPAGRPIPIDAHGQFCAVCHSYVGVHIDCFACHAAIPARRGGLKAAPLKAAFRVPWPVQRALALKPEGP